jgi:hypothetical protein
VGVWVRSVSQSVSSLVSMDSLSNANHAPAAPPSEQYRKAVEAAGLQMEKFRTELAAERAARERAAEELAAERAARSRDADEMKKLSTFYDKFKRDRSTTFSGMYDREISPYFEELRKSAGELDPAISDRVDSLGGALQASLTSGVTDPREEDQLLVLRACASVQKHTSSELNKSLKTEKEWAQKYEGLMQKLAEQESRTKEHEGRVKEHEARAKEYETRVKEHEARVKELEAKFAASPHERLMNTATHFPPPVQIEAVASAGGNSSSSGSMERNFTSLFSLSGPTTDWRSRYPEPPPVSKPL